MHHYLVSIISLNGKPVPNILLGAQHSAFDIGKGRIRYSLSCNESSALATACSRFQMDGIVECIQARPGW
jgi:hypothetical protein